MHCFHNQPHVNLFIQLVSELLQTVSQGRVTLDHEANGMYTGINLSVVWFTTITVSDGEKGGKKRGES